MAPKKKRVSASRRVVRPKHASHKHWLTGTRLSRTERESYWRDFARKYRGHPALQADTVYALPIRLVAAIQRWAPELLNSDDLAFENDLAIAAGPGFFLRNLFWYLDWGKVDRVEDAESAALSAREAVWDVQRHDSRVEEMRHAGRTDSEIEQSFAAAARLERKVTERLTGFAGWLATNADFRAERDWLRNQWGSEIRRVGHCPIVPKSLVGEAPAETEWDQALFIQFQLFYWRWGIERMTTWDLPLPMRPELLTPTLYHLPSVHEGGLLLFIPWYLLQDKAIKLHELAEQKRTITSLDQLNGWLGGANSGKSLNWGHKRYGIMLKLYVYIELALRARYGDRLEGRTEQLDRALGSFLAETQAENSAEFTAESLRKIRQRMNKRLQAASTASAH